MRFSHLKIPLVFSCAILAASGCDQALTSPEAELSPNFARSQGSRPSLQAVDPIAAFVEGVNARFAASGLTVRLDYPWLFTLGWGTDPYQSLRTGSRWTTMTPEYILDVADFAGTAVSAAEIETTMMSAYATWNAVPQSGLVASRGADPTENVDILDGVYVNGECVLPWDLTSPNLEWHQTPDGKIVIDDYHFATDIVVGGFPPASYFADCLGSDQIIGVTWSFSDIDRDGDQYRDRVYVEQLYNPGFDWATSGATFLDSSAPIDLETILVHENGHAHGLGHFGGPLPRQKLRLKGNGDISSPEAVMNPYYFGGEDRELHPTDEAALLTMYSRGQ